MAARTVVARTKLNVPTFRHPVVRRAALAARLDGDFRVALVSAPAGYGKTATLASWATSVDEPVAWLSCDPSDVEPVRFMSCLLGAISTCWDGADDDAAVLLERDTSNTYDAAVAVANSLAAAGARGVIVVDDLHLAAPEPAVLAGFIRALPDRVRLVIGTRSDPPLSLSRLRVSGELLELRADDLRFREPELDEFLAAHGIALTSDEVHRVHALTEGWPAGVQLASIALRRRDERDGFLEAFARTDRPIADFLLNEVLADLPDEVIEFLLATSVLDAFDSALCEAVTGIDDAGRMLDRLLAANLFVVPLDDRTPWYRYHHLFATFLRARLASLGTARLHGAHDRAGRALLARGDAAGALQHAMAIGDADRLGDILGHVATQPLSLPGEPGTAAQAIRLWLHEQGVDAIERDPMRLVEFVIGLVTLGGGEEAVAWLRRVEQAHAPASGELRALVEAAWAEYRQHQGEPLAAIAHLEAASAAVDGRPPDHGLLILLPVTLARAQIQAGDVVGATRVLADALENPVGHRIVDEVRVPALAAFAAARSGEIARAEQLADRALRTADELGLGPQELGRTYAGLALVEVLLERYADVEAAELLQGVKRLANASGRVTFRAAAALAEARAARAVGDEAAAAGLLEHALVLHEAPDPALSLVFDEEAAMQALRFEPRRAERLIARIPMSRTNAHHLRARLALRLDDRRAAASILADAPAPTTRREAVERSVLLASSVAHRDVGTAVEHVRTALSWASPERMLRTVVDAAPDVYQLLKAYPAEPDQERYVDDLLSHASRSLAPVRTSVVTKLVEPLSEREITVLRYLCSRLTYQEIAAALYVSLNTLKSHVRAVYRKLGVASRADAVRAGREHALI